MIETMSGAPPVMRVQAVGRYGRQYNSVATEGQRGTERVSTTRTRLCHSAQNTLSLTVCLPFSLSLSVYLCLSLTVCLPFSLPLLPLCPHPVDDLGPATAARRHLRTRTF
eukprot:COSAG03_NODE_638_length_6574_cov_63.934054_7_plen_110_part_00